MTARYRRAARALALGAGGTAAATPYTAPGHPVLLASGLYVTLLLAWCARCYYAGHRRALAEQAWEKAHVLGERPEPLIPCCLLARHGDGTAHDRQCTDEFHRIVADHLDTDHAPRSSP
ncbi:hypothetical protein [Streptomyces sp. NPDC002952]|uniref:hypothetical protein n=1 Tax=Streptomyces sp. NPDC002952 TaxID=3364673 RepID=UPI0036B1839C